DTLAFSLTKPRAIIKSTKVVLSVVGPYTYHGEKFLQLCVEEGTCWVDLAGEIPWAKEMILRYGELAKQTGSIVCCFYLSPILFSLQQKKKLTFVVVDPLLRLRIRP